MDVQFRHTELFGGAIVVDLPEGFEDVSAIRQVPDNQEVYLDANGFTSIIFDITERVADVRTDEEALRYHFDDVVERGEGVRVLESGAVTCAKVAPNTPTLHLLATTTTPPRSSSSSSAPTPNFVVLSLLLVRLQAQETDIVVTINVPFMPGAYDVDDVDVKQGKLGRLREGLERMMERVRGSFEVKNWTLFGEGDQNAPDTVLYVPNSPRRA